MLAIASLLVSGCSWLGAYDRREKYLEAESIERVEIPATLDKPEFRDLMSIPEVEDSRGISGRKLEVGLPEALGGFGVDQIVIKKLGDSRWVFLDAPPATVWPKVKRFWEVNNFLVETADPRRGILETRWLVSEQGSTDEIFEDIKDGRSLAQEPEIRHKFRLRVEPGIRAGSSEIFIEHKQQLLGAPYRSVEVKWETGSDSPELEDKMLTSLAYYLGETINQRQSVSLLAGGIRGTRTELVPDDRKPVLKYMLPFNRAWATVGAALEDARIDVEDLDRSAAIYYVYYDDSQTNEPGFLSRLFSRDEENVAAGQQNRYLVHVESAAENEVHVTVQKDENTPADALVAERLLKIIKEYST